MTHRYEQQVQQSGKLTRRKILRVAAAAAPGLVIGSGRSSLSVRPGWAAYPQQQEGRRLPLESEFLCQLTATLEPPLVLANTPGGTRQIPYVTGGQVEGPEVNGEVLPGGGDWLLFRPDGVGEVDVRLVVRLDDGELLYTSYMGYAVIPPDVFGRILVGESVDPAEYYFRITPRFETGSETHGWLNGVVAVGLGEVGPGVAWVSYSVYRIL